MRLRASGVAEAAAGVVRRSSWIVDCDAAKAAGGGLARQRSATGDRRTRPTTREKSGRLLPKTGRGGAATAADGGEGKSTEAAAATAGDEDGSCDRSGDRGRGDSAADRPGEATEDGPAGEGKCRVTAAFGSPPSPLLPRASVSELSGSVLCRPSSVASIDSRTRRFSSGVATSRVKLSTFIWNRSFSSGDSGGAPGDAERTGLSEERFASTVDPTAAAAPANNGDNGDDGDDDGDVDGGSAAASAAAAAAASSTAALAFGSGEVRRRPRLLPSRGLELSWGDAAAAVRGDLRSSPASLPSPHSGIAVAVVVTAATLVVVAAAVSSAASFSISATRRSRDARRIRATASSLCVAAPFPA